MNRRSQYGNRNSNRSTGITYAQAVRKREMLIEEISSLVAQKLARDGQYYLNESNQELLEEGIFANIRNATLAGLLAVGGMTGKAQTILQTPAGKIDTDQKVTTTINNQMPEEAVSELKELAKLTQQKVGTAEVMFKIATIEGLDLRKAEDREEYESRVGEYASLGKSELFNASEVILPSFLVKQYFNSKVGRASDYLEIYMTYDMTSPSQDSISIGIGDDGSSNLRSLSYYSDSPKEVFEYLTNVIKAHMAAKIRKLSRKAYGVNLARQGVTRMTVPPQSYPKDVEEYLLTLSKVAGKKTVAGEPFTNVKRDGKLVLPFSRAQVKAYLTELFEESDPNSQMYDIDITVDKIMEELDKKYAFKV